MRDPNANCKVVYSVAPAAITASTNGAAVDLAESAGGHMVQVNVGVVTTADATNFFTFTVETSANGSDGWTAIAADAYLSPRDQDGNTWDRLINATTEGPLAYQFGFRNDSNHRYARVVATETLTASAVFGASIVLSPLKRAPNV